MGEELPRLHADLRLPLDRFELRVELETITQITGIFGPSGSGKTSLLQAIAGMRPQARGEIRLGEQVWLQTSAGRWIPPEKRDIGYVPQDGLLFPHLDVRRNLLSGAGRARRRGRPVDATLESVCRVLQLSPLLHRKVSGLSGGERQRVALGRALCSGPRLLLLDEPLAALDLALRRRALPFLQKVCHEFQVPVLLVSHDPVEVQALCSDVIALSEGSVVARGTPEEVLTDPQVFPFAARHGFENILRCRLLSSDSSVSELEVRNTDFQLVARPSRQPPGSPLLLSIPARDIIIATERPSGLSAQNMLPAVIGRIQRAGEFHLVTAAIHNNTQQLAVEVTERALRQLELTPGRPVFLIIKAASCSLLESGSQ